MFSSFFFTTYFNHLYLWLTNQNEIDLKRPFVLDQLPFSSLFAVTSFCLGYILLVFGGQWLLRSFQFPPFKFKTLFFLHNFSLSLFSGALLFAFVEHLYPMIQKHGLFYAMCHENALTQPLYILYYINYLTKLVELMDTVFLVLKQKEIVFLHWYHHSLTLILCYTQIKSQSAVQWIPITLNLFVHIIMYFYYAFSSLGVRFRFKQLITTIQILQFILDLIAIYFCFSIILLHQFQFDTHLGYHLTCTGDITGGIFAVLLISSYLLLFLQFFVKTYSKQPNQKKGKRFSE